MNFDEAVAKCEDNLSNLYQPSFSSIGEIYQEDLRIAKELASGVDVLIQIRSNV